MPISSLNVNISQFFDMGRKNGKNRKNKLKFLGRNLLFADLEMYFRSKITLEIKLLRADIVLFQKDKYFLTQARK